MAQINTVVGDLEGNSAKIADWIDRARGVDADIVTFPELALTGYPPEDLLLKPQFIAANLDALQKLVAKVSDITAIIGFVDRQEDIFNAAAIAQGGRLFGVYHKMFLPNYGVFDEFRYFKPGRSCSVIRVGDVTVGVSICEDIWYPDGPFLHQAVSGGAEVIINISSSPYHAGKRRWRETMLATRASDNSVIVAYTNLVGGQDELVFDGDSLVFNENGVVIARGRQFEEDLVVADVDVEGVFRRRLHDPRHRQQTGSGSAHVLFDLPQQVRARAPLASVAEEPLSDEAEIYRALVVGTRDYVIKTVSGGLCSASVEASIRPSPPASRPTRWARRMSPGY
jgi:NAD+ synthase (glutamine-hydrolysing)